MRIGFIGDIVGRPGRKIIKENLTKIKKEFEIDFVVANGENASHGFGLTVQGCNELLKSGIDLITGGNHSFDKKKDMMALLETQNVLRPDNYPEGLIGSGIKICDIQTQDGIEKLAVINLMGQYGMPTVENPFNWAKRLVTNLHEENIKNIFIDFHAEATSEKRIMLMIRECTFSSIAIPALASSVKTRKVICGSNALISSRGFPASI